VVELKAKAVRDKFEDTFINGDVSVDAKSFDGVDKLTTSGQTVSMGANGATLSLDKLDELIDTVKGGKPHILLMSRRSRRKMGALSRATGSGLLETDRNEFGMMVQYYDGIPIGINDYVSDALTVGSSADCSSIYAVQLGEGALVGLSGPGGASSRTRGQPGGQGCHAHAGEVVRVGGAVQHAEAGQARRREGLEFHLALR